MRRDSFQAIADPVRRRIIELVAVQPRSINQIAQYFSVSRPAISKHVKVLEACGMIEIEKRGRERWCRVNFNAIRDIANWAMKYELYWTESIARL